MGKTFKGKIQKNMQFLAENTTSLVVLLTILWQRKIISEEENDHIKSKATPFEKNSELYSILTKKDENCSHLVLESLKESGNEYIVKKLTGDFSNNKLGDNSVLWYDIRPPTQYYVGRIAELKKIEKYWQESIDGKTITFCVITGLGGVGKMDFAKTFIVQIFNKDSVHCIGINAESTQSVSHSFRGLAQQMDISINNKTFEELSEEVYRKLSGLDKHSIIFFDNIENYDQPFLKDLITFYTSKLSPREKKPFIILTSRYGSVQKWFGTIGIQIELVCLIQLEAERFFKNALGAEEDENVNKLIGELADKLGRYPLALRQASAYIKEKNTSNLERELQLYLQDFSKKAKTLLSHPLPLFQQLGVNSTTTYLTWKLTLEKIESCSKTGIMAKNAMNVIAFLFPENIGIEFAIKVIKGCTFSEFSSTNRKRQKFEHNFFQTLNDYSMCKLTDVDSVRKISLHPLVQHVIRINLEENNQLVHTLDSLVKSITNLLAENSILSKDIIHVTTIWLHCSTYNDLVKKHQEFPELICRQFLDNGMFGELLDFSSKVLSTLENYLGRENRRTLRMAWTKGVSLKLLGKRKKALLVLKQVYKRQEALFGKEDTHTIDTYKDIKTKSPFCNSQR